MGLTIEIKRSAKSGAEAFREKSRAGIETNLLLLLKVAE